MHFWMSISTSVPHSLLAKPAFCCHHGFPANVPAHPGFTNPLVMPLASWCDPALVAPLSASAPVLCPLTLLIQPHSLLFIIPTCANPCPFPGWVLLPTVPDSLPMLSHSWFILISWVLVQIFTLQRPFLNHTWCVTWVSSLSELEFIELLLREGNDGWSCSSYCSHIFPHQLKRNLGLSLQVGNKGLRFALKL